MVLKKRLIVVIIILGGLIMAGLSGLSACGLNKDSREWIEKNRVADIYKVYPTKNPEDLFKVFPDGFDIEQSYIDEKGRAFRIYLEGEPDSKVISGEMVQNPNIKGTKKVADVICENEKLNFSNVLVDVSWPIDGFLFQKLSINQNFLDQLETENYGYNSQTGEFHIRYDLTSSKVDNLLEIDESKLTRFEIIGDGKDYYRRTVLLEFYDGVNFSETIKKNHK